MSGKDPESERRVGHRSAARPNAPQGARDLRATRPEAASRPPEPEQPSEPSAIRAAPAGQAARDVARGAGEQAARGLDAAGRGLSAAGRGLGAAGRGLGAAGRVAANAAKSAWRGLRAVPWRSVKPGYYLLAALLILCLGLWARSARLGADLTAARAQAARLQAAAARDASSFTWPIVGAGLPADSDNWPGAPRAYRKGASQGFVFMGTDSGVPVTFGAPVVAAADGTVTSATLDYNEMRAPAYAALLKRVQNGASESDLNLLRGRQVTITQADGSMTRYGQLSRIASGVKPGSSVHRGDLIGFAGNSGTLDAARGTRDSPRLLFELWTDATHYLGQGVEPAALRRQATERFKPWP